MFVCFLIVTLSPGEERNYQLSRPGCQVCTLGRGGGQAALVAIGWYWSRRVYVAQAWEGPQRAPEGVGGDPCKEYWMAEALSLSNSAQADK